MNNVLDLLVEEAQDIRQRISDSCDGSRYTLLKLTVDLENWNEATPKVILHAILPPIITVNMIWIWIRNPIIAMFFCINTAETRIGAILYAILIISLSIWYAYDECKQMKDGSVIQTSRILLIQKRISKVRNTRVNNDKLEQSIRQIRYYLGN